MLRTRIKLCGMTQADQVAQAVDFGVDAIGMILHADSPRTISLEQAQKIRQVVPAFVTLVGVFVDADAQFIDKAVSVIGLNSVQLHGDESPEMIEYIQVPVIKALRARSKVHVIEAIQRFESAHAVLLDPYHKDMHGGTGLRLDSSLWPSELEATSGLKLILAGGLAPDSIEESLTQFKPYAVDVNSGVEVSPGVKDMLKVETLCRAVRAFDILNS